MSSSPLATRLLASAFLVSLAAVGGGCGSSEESVDVDFVGVYRPTTGGNIDAIMFSANKDYMLMPTGCRAQACAEIGRFQFDAPSKLLALTDAKTGATRYLPVQVMETSGTAKTGGSLVTTKTQQLLNGGGGQQLNSSGGQQLANPSGDKLAEAGTKLIEAILKALIDMQQMQQDKGDEKKDDQKDEDKKDEEKKDEEKPFDLSCQQGVPTPASTPADAAAYWARCPQGVVTRMK